MIANAEYRLIWGKIERFELDQPHVSVTFTDKLVAETKWSRTFALKAIYEYKRFMFLCRILPHGAAPSHTVDQVWHLHLTFTQSYWNEFCKNVLGKDIHHYPSSGGKDQDAYHQKWYEDTLDNYAKVFEEIPPEAFWPRPKHKNLQDPTISFKALLLKYICISIAIPFVLSLLLYRHWNMFQLAGPDFVVFYSLLLITTVLATWFFRHIRNQLFEKEFKLNGPKNVNPFQVAYHTKDLEHADHTAIINLIEVEKLQLNADGSYTVQREPLVPNAVYEANPLRKKINYYGIGEVITYDTMRSFVSPLNYTNAELSGWKLWLPWQHEVFAYWVFLAIGCLRLGQGIYHEKPITYLVLLLLLGSVFYGAVSYLTPRSLDDVLKSSLRDQYETLWKADKFSMTQNFAVFGPSMLHLIPGAAILAASFYPVNQSNASSSSSDSGDGSSSCSSGDGGSSCGGGCGGCGGGD